MFEPQPIYYPNEIIIDTSSKNCKVLELPSQLFNPKEIKSFKDSKKNKIFEEFLIIGAETSNPVMGFSCPINVYQYPKPNDDSD